MANFILDNLEFDKEQGKITYKGIRYILIRPETLMEFVKEVELTSGDGWKEMAFKGGFTGGPLSAKKFKESFSLSEKEIVEFMANMGTEIGWGKINLVHFDLNEKELVIEVVSSPFAEAYGVSSFPVCDFIRGVFAGVGASIFGTPVNSTEESCLAMGNEICRIVVKGEQGI